MNRLGEFDIFFGLFGILVLVNIIVYMAIVLRKTHDIIIQKMQQCNGFKMFINMEHYNSICKEQRKIPIGTILMKINWVLAV